jgi:GntR family transcriptional regulator/MocR family aminotransferase
MLLDLPRSGGPLYRRIYLALKTSIRGGRLNPGARLPSTRTLAADLGVSRNSVMLAYEQLAAEGYVVNRDRSAASVAETQPTRRAASPPRSAKTARAALSAYGRFLVERLPTPPSSSYAPRPGLRYDFRYGRPSPYDFPREIWRRLLAERLRRGSSESTGYGPPSGYEPLRAALKDYVGRARGVTCDIAQIVIVSGSQQAFDICARLLINPGDAVAIEEPNYPGVALPFAAAGARLIPVPVDGEGLDPARLPAPNAGARAVCVSPCHQFPTGVVMPVGRRMALLDWAQRAGAWVVEDDYASELRYVGRPIEALQALDRDDRVIHVGTFSKTLLPALRLAYVVLPRSLVAPFVSAKWLADRYTAMLGQETLADFIAGGHFERYLRRACTRNAARRKVLVESLERYFGDRVEIAGENAGVHLLVWFKGMKPHDLPHLIARAEKSGVGLYSAAPFYSTPPKRAGLLFGYAALTETEIRAGIRKLATILERCGDGTIGLTGLIGR